ncbi:MAG: hypothetical protein JXB48_08600, partial [Candidatus Latescibacteria bacterium]|nr:hypothetical protein [Candidatus Latescibacterota bacterium]
MNLTEKIFEHAKTLSESKQLELLDFAGYLREKEETEENEVWSQFSLASAMQGLEGENSEYSVNDL